jgi:phage/plasmid-associated DNA primase
MWRPFEMENIIEYTPKNEETDKLLNHIKILCGNDNIVYDYFCKWIGQMIKYPSVKTICPTLISKEGAGKGTFLLLMRKMLGNDKIFETTQPSRDVWGDFNGVMANTFLVNLNELSKKDTIENEGKIKGLITDPRLTINNKGLNKFEINSFHRFIITTNNEEPIVSKKDDRRNLIIRSSDEKIGDKEYFKNLHKILEDVNVIKTCYEYFKGLNDLDTFNKIEKPVTEYQANIQEGNRSHIELWLEDFTAENFDQTEVVLLGNEKFNLFKKWCEGKNIENGLNAVKVWC